MLHFYSAPVGLIILFPSFFHLCFLIILAFHSVSLYSSLPFFPEIKIIYTSLSVLFFIVFFLFPSKLFFEPFVILISSSSLLLYHFCLLNCEFYLVFVKMLTSCCLKFIFHFLPPLLFFLPLFCCIILFSYEFCSNCIIFSCYQKLFDNETNININKPTTI